MSVQFGLPDLMEESETALWYASQNDAGPRARAATWITSDFNLLEVWRVRHEHLMQPVAKDVRRFGQPARLRAAGVLLAERCAFVEYLRANEVSAEDRERMLTQLRGSKNSSRALLDEHQEYLYALCSMVCIEYLLHRMGDPMGVRMLQRYKDLYVDSFASLAENLLSASEQTSDRADEADLPPEARRLKRVLTSHPT